MNEFARDNNVPAKTDYISREWLLDVVENIIKWDTERDRNRAIHQVRELTPAADVRPVVRGHWFMISYDEAGCSCCGYDRSTPFESTREAKEKWNELPPFCEMCGADMRKEVPGHE